MQLNPLVLIFSLLQIRKKSNIIKEKISGQHLVRLYVQSQPMYRHREICAHTPAREPPRTLSVESVGKLFLGTKQRAFLSVMLLRWINIPPLNHSDHRAVWVHDGNFNFLCGSTAVRRMFAHGWFSIEACFFSSCRSIIPNSTFTWRTTDDG